MWHKVLAKKNHWLLTQPEANLTQPEASQGSPGDAVPRGLWTMSEDMHGCHDWRTPGIEWMDAA
jgi:hypothetical protein